MAEIDASASSSGFTVNEIENHTNHQEETKTESQSGTSKTSEESGSSKKKSTKTKNVEGKQKLVKKTEPEAGTSKDKTLEEKKRIAKDQSDISEAGPSRERSREEDNNCVAGPSYKNSEERELTIEEKIKEEKIRIANEILKEKIRKGKEEIEKREKLKNELTKKELKNGQKSDKSTEIGKLENLNEGENQEEENNHLQENGKEIRKRKKRAKFLKNEQELEESGKELGESSKTNQELVEGKKQKALRMSENEMKKEENDKNNKLENALIVKEGEASVVLNESSDTKSIKEDNRNKKRKKVLVKKKSKCKKVYGKPDWQKHISHLKGNKKNSDFQFIVGEEKTIFYGHKFIFACRSPEFDKLFYSAIRFDGKVGIPGVKLEDFTQLYNYVYTGKIQLSGSSIEGILKSSSICKFYEIIDKCDHFLAKYCLDFECEFNVFEIFKLTNRFKLPLAEAKCLSIFACKYRDLFESPEFLACSKETIMKITSYPMHSCKEIDLYFAVDKWSAKYCEETKTNKNSIIKSLLKNIRFNSMSLEDFSKVTGVFTTEEIEEIRNEIETTGINHQRLCQKNLDEVEIISCNRFPNPPQRTIDIRTVRESELLFTTDTLILCYGFGIFGFKVKSPKESTFLIQIKDRDDEVIADGKNEIIFDGSKEIYEILFKKPIVLQPDVNYKAWIKLIEKPSLKVSVHCGVDGARQVETTGCVFTFEKSSNIKIKHDSSKIGILASVLFKV